MALILDGTNGETFPSWTTSGRPSSPSAGQMGYNTTIGQFDAYTSNGWVSVGTSGSTVQNTAASMPTGSVIQTVYATSSTNSSNTTTTLASTGLTATITPQFSSSKVLCFGTVNLQLQPTSAIDAQANFNVTRNGTQVWGNQTYDQLRMTANASGGSEFGTGWPFIFQDSPASTSSLTYLVNYACKSSGITVVCSDSSQPNYMILMEIR